MIQTVSIETSSGCVLRGVLHLPENRESARRVAGLLLPGLVGTRAGPHRLLYDLAERLNGNGLPVLRCDPRGSGYSDGGDRPATTGTHVRDVGEMLEWLTREVGAEAFLAGGICRGARVALAAALADRRVKRLMLLSCPKLHEKAIGRKIARRRLAHLKAYGRKLLNPKWVPRLLADDLNLPVIRQALAHPLSATVVRDAATGECDPPPRGFQAHAVFVYGERDPDVQDSLEYYRRHLAGADCPPDYRIVPRADAGFYAWRWHQAVLDTLEQWWSKEHP